MLILLEVKRGSTAAPSPMYRRLDDGENCKRRQRRRRRLLALWIGVWMTIGGWMPPCVDDDDGGFSSMDRRSDDGDNGECRR